MIILFIEALIIVLTYVIISYNYKKTEYYKATHLSYLQMRMDKGRAGEYYTYKYLKSLSGIKRFLFNCYIPKDDGTTTEIDVILIHESGIYVFESKNYSGWIFGTETQEKWVQTLPTGKGKSQKSYFINPIIQNKGHIKWLQAYLQNDSPNLPFYSYIVFSNRCTLKEINLTSNSHFVINRYNILQAVLSQVSKSEIVLTQDKIESLYNKLYPLTQVDDDLKKAHIENIQQNINQPQESFHNANIQNTQSTQSSVSVQNESETASSLFCPLCGGHLILRTANRGKHSGQKFYGCSNYPKCRFTKNINNNER